MSSRTLSLLFILCAFVLFISAEDSWEEDVGRTVVTIEQLLSPNEWSPRGTISFRSSHMPGSTRSIELAHFEQSKDKPVDEMEKFQNLVDNDQFYTIRAKIPSQDRYVMSSIKACALLQSNFEDTITLHLDYSGVVIGMDYSSATSKCALFTQVKTPNSQIAFHTEAKVKYGVAGGVPRPSINVAPPPKEANAKQEKEEVGFFQKYWLYILIGIVLMNVVPSLLGVGADSAAPAAGAAGARGAAAPRRR